MSRDKLDRTWGMQKGNLVKWRKHNRTGVGAVVKNLGYGPGMHDVYLVETAPGVTEEFSQVELKRIPIKAQIARDDKQKRIDKAVARREKRETR